jgi:hypothetical protein
MTNITTEMRLAGALDLELKNFMEDLWGAEGDFINTPLGRGRIENVRTKAGIDLEVIVKIPDMDGFTLFSGMELFEMERV